MTDSIDTAWAKASPEKRNAMVAEVLFGFLPWEKSDGRECEVYSEARALEAGIPYVETHRGKNQGYMTLDKETRKPIDGDLRPAYTSTWSGAGLVIDRMTTPKDKGGLGWEVSIHWQFNSNDKWRARFARFENEQSPQVPGEWVNGQAQAPSAPEAIALAAVRALEAKDEK